jgi:hypothetical protein
MITYQFIKKLISLRSIYTYLRFTSNTFVKYVREFKETVLTKLLTKRLMYFTDGKKKFYF